MQETFYGVQVDFRNLPKSAIFKTMGYSPSFLLKIGRFWTRANTPEIFTNNPANSQKSICLNIGGFLRSLGRFPELTKIRHVQSHGLQPSLFTQNPQISDPCEFTRNLHQQSRKQLEIHLQACRRRFTEFGTIPGTYQNPPPSKPWAIAQAFCSKLGDFRPLRIHPKSSVTIPQTVRNPFSSMWAKLYREVWTISGTFENPPSSKPWAIAQAFCSKQADFRPVRIHPKYSVTILQKGQKSIPKHVGNVLQGVLDDFRNLPKSAIKPWAIAQAFSSKLGDFGFRTHSN